jgi:hypothetical protein
MEPGESPVAQKSLDPIVESSLVESVCKWIYPRLQWIALVIEKKCN